MECALSAKMRLMAIPVVETLEGPKGMPRAPKRPEGGTLRRSEQSISYKLGELPNETSLQLAVRDNRRSGAGPDCRAHRAALPGTQLPERQTRQHGRLPWRDCRCGPGAMARRLPDQRPANRQGGRQGPGTIRQGAADRVRRELAFTLVRPRRRGRGAFCTPPDQLRSEERRVGKE